MVTGLADDQHGDKSGCLSHKIVVVGDSGVGKVKVLYCRLQFMMTNTQND